MVGSVSLLYVDSFFWGEIKKRVSVFFTLHLFPSFCAADTSFDFINDEIKIRRILRGKNLAPLERV